MKDGIKTTEFWLSIITIIGNIVGVLFQYIKPETAMTIVGILTGLYIIARTIVKITSSTKDDALLNAIFERILSKIGVKEKNEG